MIKMYICDNINENCVIVETRRSRAQILQLVRGSSFTVCTLLELYCIMRR